MGAYAPIHLTRILNFRKLKQKIHTYIFTCYALTKLFHENRIYHVTYVKKDKIQY
jgi:hypothetical protein